MAGFRGRWGGNNCRPWRPPGWPAAAAAAAASASPGSRPGSTAADLGARDWGRSCRGVRHPKILWSAPITWARMRANPANLLQIRELRESGSSHMVSYGKLDTPTLLWWYVHAPLVGGGGRPPVGRARDRAPAHGFWAGRSMGLLFLPHDRRGPSWRAGIFLSPIAPGSYSQRGYSFQPRKRGPIRQRVISST